ncbi:MAG: hypothetical protein ACRD5M_02075 [Candidatus Acidiferrales bacterium]
MRNRSKVLSLAAVALAFFVAGGSLRAQTAPAAPPPPPPDGGDVLFLSDGMGPDLMEPPEAIGIVGVEGELGGKTVAGAPFTANFSSQTSETLSDGNHINRSTTGTLARDAQGRTRRDMTLSGIGPWSSSGKAKQVSMIHDPVTGSHYILEPDKKIAREIDRINGKGMGREHKHEHANGFALGGRGNDANVTTTSLGTETINGVSAEGTRLTRTIPAGAIGNEKPIVITVERWYSPDLQTVVKTTRSDPRTGETVMQLTKIQRAEPDASLFQVPADYTIQKGGRIRTRHMQPPPPSD